MSKLNPNREAERLGKELSAYCKENGIASYFTFLTTDTEEVVSNTSGTNGDLVAMLMFGCSHVLEESHKYNPNFTLDQLFELERLSRLGLIGENNEQEN